MDKEVFRLEGVSYIYCKRFSALYNIDLTINRGESVAILGANGSGKTTLLKILAALIFPSEGLFMAFSKQVTEDSMRGTFNSFFRRRVGIVFSEPDIQLFCPTVWDELAFGPLQLDIEKETIEGRVDDLIEMLGLEQLRDRSPRILSSGEKKKVAIAAILSLNPEVLLLDEPTSGLDPRSQVWLIELIGQMKALNKTIIIATHDLSMAEDISDRAIALGESHKLVADRETHDLLGDRHLLLEVNLIHSHSHRHGRITHKHSHSPFARHDEH